VQVSALNAVGESPLSGSLNVKFANVPTVPTSVSTTATKESLTLSWAAPASTNGDAVSAYKVYLDDGKGGDLELIETTIASSFSYIIEGIECGLTYNAEITAVNGAGESLPAQVNKRVGQVSLSPRNLKLSAVVPTTSVTLTWEAPLDTGCLPITSYVLSRDGADLALSISADSSQAIDTTATGAIGTTYTYKMKAVNSAGNSEYTEEITVTVGSVPNAPSNLAINERISATSVELKWDADIAIASNPATTAYRVYFNDGTGANLMFDSASYALTTRATISGLVLGNSYTATVRAVNAIGESADSGSITVHAATLPSKIQSVTLLSSTTTSIKIQWATPASNGGMSLTQYTVYHDAGQTGSFTSYVESDTSVHSFDLTGLTTGQLVDFRVSSTNAEGESELSDSVTFYVATVPATPATPTSGGVSMSLSY